MFSNSESCRTEFADWVALLPSRLGQWRGAGSVWPSGWGLQARELRGEVGPRPRHHRPVWHRHTRYVLPPLTSLRLTMALQDSWPSPSPLRRWRWWLRSQPTWTPALCTMERSTLASWETISPSRDPGSQEDSSQWCWCPTVLSLTRGEISNYWIILHRIRHKLTPGMMSAYGGTEHYN